MQGHCDEAVHFLVYQSAADLIEIHSLLRGVLILRCWILRTGAAPDQDLDIASRQSEPSGTAVMEQY